MESLLPFKCTQPHNPNISSTPSTPTQHPCTHVLTHARPGLPVIPDPNLTPASQYALELHYTVTSYLRKNFTHSLKYIFLSEDLQGTTLSYSNPMICFWFECESISLGNAWMGSELFFYFWVMVMGWQLQNVKNVWKNATLYSTEKLHPNQVKTFNWELRNIRKLYC